MPTITKYRKYCISCEDFTLHSKRKDDYICKCKTIYSDFDFKNIAINKVKLQQERYQKSQVDFLMEIPGMLNNNRFSNKHEVRIIEDDCGYIEIAKQKRIIEIEKKKKQLQILKDWKE
jgi:hypothetical protein